jgi:hypothetical protein
VTTVAPHTTRCTLGPPHPRTGDVPVYGPSGPDGPTLGVVVATNPRAAADARLWARAWELYDVAELTIQVLAAYAALNPPERWPRGLVDLHDRALGALRAVDRGPKEQGANRADTV